MEYGSSPDEERMARCAEDYGRSCGSSAREDRPDQALKLILLAKDIGLIDRHQIGEMLELFPGRLEAQLGEVLERPVPVVMVSSLSEKAGEAVTVAAPRRASFYARVEDGLDGAWPDYYRRGADGHLDKRSYS